MKKISPNQIVAFKNNLIFIAQLHSLVLKRISFLLVFLLSFVSLSAQNGSSEIPTITEVKSYISSLKVLEKNSPSSFSNAQNVEDLIYKLQSSIYLSSGDVKIFGENPKNLYTDIASLGRISSLNLLKTDLEIVIIKIDNSNDFNSKIDLSVFSDFYKLKYIYILSSVNTTEQNIAKMFLNYDEQYSIFYKIEKGE